MRDTSDLPAETPWEGFTSWMASLSWGDVPAWVGLVLAGVAVFITLRTYRHSVAVRTEAQARLVYAVRTKTEHLAAGTECVPSDAIGSTSDKMLNTEIVPWRLARAGVQVLVTVHNGSDELLPLVVFQIDDPGMEHRVSSWAIMSSVPPRSSPNSGFYLPTGIGTPPRGGVRRLHRLPGFQRALVATACASILKLFSSTFVPRIRNRWFAAALQQRAGLASGGGFRGRSPSIRSSTTPSRIASTRHSEPNTAPTRTSQRSCSVGRGRESCGSNRADDVASCGLLEPLRQYLIPAPARP